MADLVVGQNAILNSLRRRLTELQALIEERPDDAELRERIAAVEMLLGIMPKNFAAMQQTIRNPSVH
jgi:hypothetical protein